MCTRSPSHVVLDRGAPPDHAFVLDHRTFAHVRLVCDPRRSPHRRPGEQHGADPDGGPAPIVAGPGEAPGALSAA